MKYQDLHGDDSLWNSSISFSSFLLFSWVGIHSIFPNAGDGSMDTLKKKEKENFLLLDGYTAKAWGFAGFGTGRSRGSTHALAVNVVASSNVSGEVKMPTYIGSPVY